MIILILNIFIECNLEKRFLVNICVVVNSGIYLFDFNFLFNLINNLFFFEFKEFKIVLIFFVLFFLNKFLLNNSFLFFDIGLELKKWSLFFINKVFLILMVGSLYLLDMYLIVLIFVIGILEVIFDILIIVFLYILWFDLLNIVDVCFNIF